MALNERDDDNTLTWLICYFLVAVTLRTPGVTETTRDLDGSTGC